MSIQTAYMCVYIYIYVYTHMCIYIYIYMHTHTYTHVYIVLLQLFSYLFVTSAPDRTSIEIVRCCHFVVV